MLSGGPSGPEDLPHASLSCRRPARSETLSCSGQPAGQAGTPSRPVPLPGQRSLLPEESSLQPGLISRQSSALSCLCGGGLGPEPGWAASAGPRGLGRTPSPLSAARRPRLSCRLHGRRALRSASAAPESPRRPVRPASRPINVPPRPPAAPAAARHRRGHSSLGGSLARLFARRRGGAGYRGDGPALQVRAPQGGSGAASGVCGRKAFRTSDGNFRRREVLARAGESRAPGLAAAFRRGKSGRLPAGDFRPHPRWPRPGGTSGHRAEVTARGRGLSPSSGPTTTGRCASSSGSAASASRCPRSSGGEGP